mgnify:FL=1
MTVMDLYEQKRRKYNGKISKEMVAILMQEAVEEMAFHEWTVSMNE